VVLSIFRSKGGILRGENLLTGEVKTQIVDEVETGFREQSFEVGTVIYQAVSDGLLEDRSQKRQV